MCQSANPASLVASLKPSEPKPFDLSSVQTQNSRYTKAQTLCSLKRSDSKLPVHHIDRENGRLCDVQLTTRSLSATHSDPRSDLLKHSAHSTSASHLQIPLPCTFRTSRPLDQGESTGVRHGSSKDPQRYPPSLCTQPRRLSKTAKPTTSRNILGPWSMFPPKGTLRSQGLF
jgi:hypothetical protein